jgi:hypothetical protein
MRDEKYKSYIMTAIDAALTINPGTVIEADGEEEVTSDE